MYTLYNKETKQLLKHPKVGIWTAESKQLAEEALADLHEYIDRIGMSHLKSNIIVLEVKPHDIAESAH